MLVVFDVDMTLTQPDHPATFYPALKKFKNIIENIFDSLTPTQCDIALTLTTELPQKLVEKHSPKVIKNMQEKGVHVIAFTASLSGAHIDSKNKTIFKRRESLQKMGFIFPFPGRVVSYMDFSIYAGGYPMLYHGVLCLNGENNGIGKGKVIGAFLRQVGMTKGSRYGSGYIPKIVIMVDDKEKNLFDIHKVLAVDLPDIKFIAVKYEGAFDYAPKDISEADFTNFWQGLADQAKKSCSK